MVPETLQKRKEKNICNGQKQNLPPLQMQAKLMVIKAKT
jgi:hypothetical protein